MAKSPLSSFPNELLHLVIKHIDFPSRSALARTCRSLHTITTPYLYGSAYLQKGQVDEFVRTISENERYANFVHDVKVVTNNTHGPTLRGTQTSISPCRIVPCLDRLPNLQSLALTGGYWMWDTDDNGSKPNGEKWDTLEKALWNYLQRASLEEPIGSRVSLNLRSLTMDRIEMNGQGAALNYSYAFVIPQLHHLTLRGFQLFHEDIEVDAEFERTTELKSLRIERSFVSFGALASALRAPRALQYLGISHAEDYQYHEMHLVDANNKTMQEFMDTLLLHRESLEGIKLVHEEIFRNRNGVNNRPPKVNDVWFLPYAKQLPKLERWEGCDASSMRLFLGL